MVIADGAVAAEVATPLLFCSLTSLVTMITLITMCTTCCRKKVKNGEDIEDVAYGVITAPQDLETKPVQFRIGSGPKSGERMSAPATKSSSVATLPSRVSAPLAGGTRRALPQLPENQAYAVINKTPKDFSYADEPAPTYESIDPENDSFVDPLYSKVETRPSRKYDYPVFSKSDRRTTNDKDEAFYQSASMIYGAGSEDPYSSIASEPRAALASVEDDASSAYDPGYAKVKPGGTKDVEKERTERELDQLYSKIRRGGSRRDLDSPPPGPSTVELVEPMGEMPRDLVHPANVTEIETASSREPSYRYITVRESADVVRERLRQQGQLGPPIREHYYSTIGNEYESVGDSGSATYQQVPSVVNRPTSISTSSQVHGVTNALSINVHSGEYAPPPPTSPVPDRTPDQLVPPTHRITKNAQGVNLPPGVTYATVSKPRRAVTPSGPSPTIPTVVKPPTRSRGPSESEITHTNRVIDNSTGVRSRGPSESEMVHHNRQLIDKVIVRPTVLGSSPPNSEAALAGIHEFMSRPLLPYGLADTVVNRRVTEERETVVEKRHSTGTTLDPVLSTNIKDFAYRNNNMDDSSERVHNVEIKRVQELHKPTDTSPFNRENFQPLLFDNMISRPGPSSPNSPFAGTSLKENAADSPLSDRGRSGLPVPKNDGEVRRLAERSRQRRQESIEREEKQEEQRTLSRERRTKERREEERRREMLGTIYTANDYVSPVGMGTERGWPLVGNSSPPSLRKVASEDEKDSHRERTQKVRDVPNPMSFIQP